MYVCICNAIKDREMKAAAAKSCVRSVAHVFQECGKRPQCGRCLHDVAEIIETARFEDADAPFAAE